MKKSVLLLIIAGVGIAALLLVMAFSGSGLSFFFQPTDSVTPSVSPPNGGVLAPEVVAENLSVPWEIIFLPWNAMLVTERAGTLKVISEGGTKTIPVAGVYADGESGLHGAALHPRFRENSFLYLYFTTGSGRDTYNRVVRYRFENDSLKEPSIIIDRIPGASFHDGGRIAFGPDGLLYITTGDAGKGELAQNTKSLAGKILRLTDDGSVPADNPFGNAVYSYGHRNPQGITWDNLDRLWATEHGRSGVQSGLDEINLIEKGANYGWPIIEGDERKTHMRQPAIHSGEDETWAPAAIVFYRGRLFFTGLRGQSLYEAQINSDGTISEVKAHFRQEYGRLRSLTIGNDGNLYLGVSNRDGRGEPRAGDDKILRIAPELLGL